MNGNYSISVAKFQFWILPIYFFTSAFVDHQDGVEGYQFLESPGFFKFVAAVKTETMLCTGTVVSKDWVLTAGHCLYDADGDQVPVDGATVIAGITNYQYPQEEFGQFRKSAEIHVHPSFWDKRLAKFDIALVRVNQSFVFNQWVDKIKIAGNGWDSILEKPDNCLSIGFGGARDENGPIKRLKVWNVTAAHGHKNCPCSLNFQVKRLVCAKNSDYAKLCRGDDGGPLVCGNEVHGIAHMVRNWYNCDEAPEYPFQDCRGSPERGMSIYMFLCPFNDWMHDIVDEIPPKPPSCNGLRCLAPHRLWFFVFVYLLLNV